MRIRRSPFIRPLLRQLRPISEKFTGRADEADAIAHHIHQILATGEAVTIVYCITGMAGVGKTSIANFIAHKLVQDFPDSQLFIELRTHSTTPRTPLQALSSILSLYEPEPDNRPFAGRRRSITKFVLRQTKW